MAEPERAVPAVTDLTRPFWDAARNGRLAIQRCADCGYYNHPPKALCDRCNAARLAFEDVAGTGTIWSYTVMHQKSVAGFEESVPYLTALVELDEQPMLLLTTNLPGLESEAVKIGEQVKVTFQRLNDEITLPQFVPVVSA
jgi:uncharacterized OB-fold protein